MGDNFERGAANFLSGLLRGYQSRQEQKMGERRQGEVERQNLERENMLREQFDLEKQAEGRRAEEEARLGAGAMQRDVGDIVAREQAVLARGPMQRGAQLEAEMARRFAPPQPEGKLPEREKLELEHGYRMAEIGARESGAKPPKTEMDFVTEQVKDWRTVGSIGPYSVRTADKTGLDDRNPTLLGRAARYKYAKAQEGNPVTDEDALAVNLALDNLSNLQTVMASAPPEDEMRIIYDEIQTETGGDFEKPMWKGRTLNALVPGMEFDEGMTYDLEDVAREAAIYNIPLAGILKALFGPQAQRRGSAQQQVSRQEVGKVQALANRPNEPTMPFGP